LVIHQKYDILKNNCFPNKNGCYGIVNNRWRDLCFRIRTFLRFLKSIRIFYYHSNIFVIFVFCTLRRSLLLSIIFADHSHEVTNLDFKVSQCFLTSYLLILYPLTYWSRDFFYSKPDHLVLSLEKKIFFIRPSKVIILDTPVKVLRDFKILYCSDYYVI